MSDEHATRTASAQHRAPPLPPRFDRLPVAVQHALRLRGALVRCGPGLRGVGWPETPPVRLTALATWLADGSIASHGTAAWVWGAGPEPAARIDLALRAGRRAPVRNSSPEVCFHEIRLAPDEKQCFGEFEVTTPRRTLLDLLHAPTRHERGDRIACRLLLRRLGSESDRIPELLTAHPKPYSRLALSRFRALTSPKAPPGEVQEFTR